MNRAQFLACPECDLLQHDAPSPRPRKALCARCGAVLYERGDGGLERTLALTVTALVLLALANAFPILTLELQDERTSATLAGAAAALWSQDMPLVAILVLFMAVLMPLAELAALAYLLLPLRRGIRAAALPPPLPAARARPPPRRLRRCLPGGGVREPLGRGGGVRARRAGLAGE